MKIHFAAAVLAAGLAVTASSILASSIPARAAEPVALRARTAGELADLCGVNPREPAADAKINYCHGFAQGVVDLELEHSKKTFCFPSPMPSRQATLNEFVAWVRAMPDHRALKSTDGLLKFFAERFPCK